ncbi:MAG: AAA family ATPase [Candidatus Cloacimonetes bacterium]|nr:AAA family ATPase [Candidatus Cloacimonadota bacterium]
MKILKIRFKNLNSLYGEWEIDFSSDAYLANGIFSITGPTGAGKSTILDAICLALYGRTPRLKSISKSSNQLMSRQTGECFSEVTFETRSGTFRSIWSQHRARKKADGSLQNAHHELYEAESGNILASQLKETATLIEEKTGMDFDRFTRSILLAQGGFAVFLQANPDDRAPILEQITGTEIYSLISVKVHERLKSENEKLEILQAATAGIELLTIEQETELDNNIKEGKKQKSDLEGENKTLTDSITWLNNISKLQKDLEILKDDAEKLTAESEAFVPEREKLQLANKAAELDSIYATLNSYRTQQKTETDNQRIYQDQLPALQVQQKTRTEQQQSAIEEVFKAKQALQTELILIKEVRQLDIIISEKQKELKNVQSEAKKIEANIIANQENKQKITDAQEKLNSQLKDISAYLDNNAADSDLIEEYTGIRERILSLKKADIELQNLIKSLTPQKKKADQDLKSFGDLQEKKKGLTEKLQAAQKEIEKNEAQISILLNNRLLREYRADYEHLLKEKAFINKISSLEAERKKLIDEQPCPLCGSEIHPYALGNIPEIDEVQRKIDDLKILIDKIDYLETRKTELDKSNNDLKTELHGLELQCQIANQKQQQAKYDLDKLRKEIETKTADNDQIITSALKILQKFGINELPVAKLDVILTKMQNRLKLWQATQQKITRIKEEHLHLSSDLTTLITLYDSLISQQKDKNTQLNGIKTEFRDLNKKRQTLYADKSPDAEELRLTELQEKAESDLETTRKYLQQTNDKLNELNTTITNLHKSIAAREITLQKLEPDFIAACRNAGFESENLLISCQMPPAARNQLAEKAKNLDYKLTEISSRKTDCEKKLTIEKEKNLTLSTLEELQQKKSETDTRINVISENIGACNQKLIANQAAKIKLKNKQQEIDAQKIECSRWKMLHDLIGSADGKKFRNFAQGLTFEMMIAHANQQLVRMNDRYLLVHDKQNPLELNVIDNYQAGEERSTKNLSGGESFLVSLALALGLSQMASHKVQVDSLFLDEGFGTLDEDALETALESLATLQQSGKLIGIISHVPALKDRISTQIKVIPQNGGKSQINGPGISNFF